MRSLFGKRVPPLAVNVVAVVTFLFGLAGPFRAGWTKSQTDFPNYYTAALALRHGLPLHEYYDWTWFARQMNYAGADGFGAYTPQTPLTMLLMVPLTAFPVQGAKQIWLACNLLFLGLTIWLLTRVTRFTMAEIWLLVFCGYFALRTNFLYGQYYVFLLFLLTAAFYFAHRRRLVLSGVMTGVAFALKLFGGPFLLYFAARREWKALLSMILATLALLGLAVGLFGVCDVHYYATQILPRTLEGGSIDPYTPLVPTLSTMLTHLFMREAELNPHPVWNAPWLFFFLRTFLSLLIVAFLVWQTSRRRNSDRRDFALFVIAILLLSTSTASYTFILLVLPVVLLLKEAAPKEAVLLVICYVLLTLPLHPTWLFPKVWLLFVLFIGVGWPALRETRVRTALAATAIVAVIALGDAAVHLRRYREEPAQRFERVAVQEGAMFSSFPAVSQAGVFYQSMGKDRYVLRWVHGGENEALSFAGQAFHPRVARDGRAIDFEMVANRTSTMMRFDPETRSATALDVPVVGDASGSVVSPDGKWVAFESAHEGPVQIWVREVFSGRVRRLTGGNCNNSAPAWELDSKSILFASDCGRAFGLPALYRANVEPQ
jgi:Glycosyltransferase family 87/WD40-like Beta Propeller Repeat